MKRLLLLCCMFTMLALFSQAQTIPSYVPTNGLVGWWPFNGNANDESGNGNHGTVNGATLTADRFGNVNSAYSFDGVNDFIGCTNAGPTGVTSLTISIWILTNQSNYAQLFGYGNEGVSGSALRLQIDGSNCGGSIAFDTYDNVKWFINSFSNIWDNYCFVYDVTTGNTINSVKLFKNGQLLNTCITIGGSNNYFSSAYPIKIGKYHGISQPPAFFNGKIDDIAIYNRALTQQEITDLYQGIPCSLNISSHPSNINTTVGNNSTFTVGVTATNCNTATSYQWQTNLGFGWQTLQNAGQYTGINTDHLQVSNVGTNNTNQQFRCIVSSGNLSDTSQAASINIINNSNNTNSGITHAIPYQAVVRDGNGNLLSNHPLQVRCTLHDSAASGNIIYQETHTISTNNLGLFTLQIGTGTPIVSSIDSINWALYKKFIQIEVDTTSQGSSYTDLGTQQLMAVPYALYAETAGNALNGPKGDKGDVGAQGPIGLTGATGPQGLQGIQGPIGVGAFTHYIGEVFGGGVIFHLWKDSVGVEHGLIVDISNLSTNQVWSNVCCTAIGPSAQSSWDGLSNSNNIVAQTGHTTSAAALCLNSTNGGQNDWYLPSIQELNILWNNYYTVARSLTQISGATQLKENSYWSSSEVACNGCGDVHNFGFSNGYANSSPGYKTNTLYVRAVRSF